MQGEASHNESSEPVAETPSFCDQCPRDKHGRLPLLHRPAGRFALGVICPEHVRCPLAGHGGTEKCRVAERGWGGLGGPRADLARPGAGGGAGGFLGPVQEGLGGKEASDPWAGAAYLEQKRLDGGGSCLTPVGPEPCVSKNLHLRWMPRAQPGETSGPNEAPCRHPRHLI